MGMGDAPLGEGMSSGLSFACLVFGVEAVVEVIYSPQAKPDN